ncbi:MULTISPECIES: peptide chain release factor N(5)-glutamine methyltransferase [unclassified Shinella]|uniref:peptide chain release factor N(5)-glutamine methyltransferase n=1 Tax=unclassified Shinella TaxID=2643062 RepID=UPI00225CD52D|nr:MULTISPECIES: peptide chain release factor N(5)-glutamine methyltransferase [unclassified Shinella]MCO5139932.1 peptide chain release factor N(5)-glutamine methyltransferase [Shinella sp.]MDC7257053.1 peptide chain release factor N(5)-glutamine methyltransferase [Shinella sp. YE25]CAI0339917.1 Release factor glutamine methyltransferase [Rhizobiaceae bacterium]CAK7258308.1 Release factor glutamine methyltransferase [Shinella sp. WSC3-e]
MNGPTLTEVLAAARRRLAGAGIPDAAGDARTLLMGLLDLTPTSFVTESGRSLDEAEQRAVDAALDRRIAREPVHRILGRRAFSRLDLVLSPETLEPRPDTEILVDALAPYAKKIVRATGGCRILDLGTGTGAICLALLDLVPGATGVGADLSAGALETARRNADINGVADRFEAVESDWFAAVTGAFDIIVSNPPYIVRSVVGTLDDEVRLHDPMLALDGGEDGLDAYRAIAAGAGAHLRENGLVAYEIGYDQKDEVTAIMREKGFSRIEAIKDLGGNDRALVFIAAVAR